jgi:integrase
MHCPACFAPVIKRLGIAKRVSWHTFRRTYTTLLHANGEDVKVVQELLRHMFGESHDGHLRAGADASQARRTTEGSGDDSTGKTPNGVQNGA